MPIITIDGNIGSGKTSILNHLHSNYNIYVDLEPIDKWKPFLDNIYNNKKNYFNFQIRVWLDRSWIQEKDGNPNIIMERSPFFINRTFNKYIYENNLITSQEHNIITELYKKSNIIWKSNYFIYLRSSPERCLERILLRGRENELDISIDYLRYIHNLHEQTYEKAIHKGYNIIVVDVENKTLEEITTTIIKYIHNII